MSHYTEIETEIKRQYENCLIDALLDVGPANVSRTWSRDVIERHESPQPLFGYQGDQRQQQAHIIVRRQHVGGASNDLGIEWRDGKAVFHISEFDKQRYGTRWQRQVKQRYGVNVAKKMLPQGYRISGEVQRADGTIEVLMRRA